MHIKSLKQFKMKKLKHIFDYMFYMAYAREEKRWAANSLLQGLLSISLIIDLYLFIIISILTKMVFKISIFSFPEKKAIIFIIIIQTIIFIISYFIYGYGKRYVRIIEKYNKENKNERKSNRLAVYLFVSLSVLIGVILFIVSVQH
ncbi:MAG: hypothetical protein DRJ02_01780 [Bacteroidetes bacterium]|nr:MAG: hypothetical protein DRJ02_01780 [Bacteroidota bacterium]